MYLKSSLFNMLPTWPSRPEPGVPQSYKGPQKYIRVPRNILEFWCHRVSLTRVSLYYV